MTYLLISLFVCVALTLYLSIVSLGQTTNLANQIDQYLFERDSPLAGRGEVFVEEGMRFNVDPRLIVAVSGAETTFGTNLGCNAPFNAWSWFWNDPNDCPNNPLDSWEEGIHFVTRQMDLYRTRFLQDDKEFTIEEIGRRYCAEGCEHWETNTTTSFQDLGGDVTDLEFPKLGQGVLWGSSSGGSINPGSVYTINKNTGLATLVGSTEVVGGRGIPEVSGVAFDPTTGTMYGITGSACSGAILITINPTTGADTVVGPLVGTGFDGTLTQRCDGGSDSLAFSSDGTLYVGGWNGGTTDGGKLMTIDKNTGTVLTLHNTPIDANDSRGAHLAGLAFDPSGTLWASRGGNAEGRIHTVDPSTGAFMSTLSLSDSAVVSDLAFSPDGTLFASLPSENVLATIDVTTGLITRIGSFGESVSRMSGLAFR